MIDKECYTAAWCERISKELHYNDVQILEKVVRALSLLELLVESGCPFIFKGGTATMLLLGDTTNRLSIDIDIICPPGTNIESYLHLHKDFGFSNIEVVERKTPGKDIPKSHSKIFYKLAYPNGTKTDGHILLDVLYEDVQYNEIISIPIESKFIKLDSEPLYVSVPSVPDILGDKMTAFAPNTTGIPYFKKSKICSTEIVKQLYDIGRLFEKIDNLSVTAEVFKKIAAMELSYRGGGALEEVYADILQTSILIATRGVEGIGKFDVIQDGIGRIKSFIFDSKYHIEDAIVDSSRAAYLAVCVMKGIEAIEKYSGDQNVVKNMAIGPCVTNKLNKLKKISPEAFYYWVKISQLLE